MSSPRRLMLGMIFLSGCLLMGLGLKFSTANIIASSGSWSGHVEAINLPWSFEHPRRDNVLTLELEATSFTPGNWHIVPDDDLTSVKVDGELVPLDHIPPESLRDFQKGFVLDLSDYLTPGRHIIEIGFHNHFSVGKIDIKPVWGFWRYALIFWGALLVLLVLSSAVKLSSAQRWILAFALVPIFFYWSATPWETRAHDVSWGGGHYDYIQYVATIKALPTPDEGWVFYHPPTYYLAATSIWFLANATGLPVHETLQLFSILLWLVFLVSSLATLNIFLKHKPGTNFIASLALALWPAGILHSPAIGNDSALYAVLGMATLFMCRWWFSGKRRDLLWMAFFCALSVLVKSNGLVLIAAGGLLLLLHFLLRRRQKKMRAFVDGLLFGIITAVGLAASFAVRIFYFIRGDSPSWLISNVGNLHGGLRVPADIKAFIPLDIPTFLTQPYLNAFEDVTGRDSFWIFLLRSSLSGEFAFPDPFLTKVAYFWGLLLLFLFFILLLGVPLLWRTKASVLYRHLPLLLLGFLWLASLVALRIQVPFSCSNDFRYIAPILLPVILFWANRGNWSSKLLVMMALSSAVFYTGVGVI